MAKSANPKKAKATKPKPTKSEAANPVGRPTLYTEELGLFICDQMATGLSLRQICAANDMPDEKTVRTWAIDPEHPISPHYDKARQKRYEKWADEILEIADDGTNDYVTKERSDGSTFEALDSEHVQRSRLRVDSRKWLLSKLLPKKFGDKVELSGTDGGPIQHSVKVAFVKPNA